MFKKKQQKFMANNAFPADAVLKQLQSQPKAIKEAEKRKKKETKIKPEVITLRTKQELTTPCKIEKKKSCKMYKHNGYIQYINTHYAFTINDVPYYFHSSAKAASLWTEGEDKYCSKVATFKISNQIYPTTAIQNGDILYLICTATLDTDVKKTPIYNNDIIKCMGRVEIYKINLKEKTNKLICRSITKMRCYYLAIINNLLLTFNSSDSDAIPPDTFKGLIFETNDEIEALKSKSIDEGLSLIDLDKKLIYKLPNKEAEKLANITKLDYPKNAKSLKIICENS